MDAACILNQWPSQGMPSGMQKSVRLFSVWFLSLGIAIISPVFGEDISTVNPLQPPDPAAVTEARQIIQRMINSERGPYQRLRWFCEDGTVHEPRPYACGERGGGRQHAQYSEDRERLAELGWHVGTIFAALKTDAPDIAGGRRMRLRELPLEKYLIDTDDGWVLRRARFYRGRVQAEDEESAGKKLLLQQLQDGAWIEDNFLLLRELQRTLPHYGAGTDLTRSVRRLSLEIADQEPSFERLRIEIHTAPVKTTAARVRDWLRQAGTGGLAEGLEEKVTALINGLEQLYGEAGRKARLEQLRAVLADMKTMEFPERAADLTPAESINYYSELLAALRRAITSPITAGRRLQLLDAMADVEMELIISCSTYLENERISRAGLIASARQLVLAAYGTGLLSAGELAALQRRFAPVTANGTPAYDAYLELSKSLNLVSGWAVGSMRYHFAEALNRYTQLDPRAAGFIDDTLRSSVLLPLARVARRLNFDAQSLGGVTKTIAGITAPSMLALNPGIADGRLRLMDARDLHDGVPLDRNEIIFLPQTVSELTPVAGVITLGEGNMLSHIQLLARNFGIPNLSLAQNDAAKLRPLSGQRVIVIAGTDGSVLVDRYQDGDARLQSLFREQPRENVKLDVPEPDLAMKRLLPLSALGKELSGVTVGPKAANLGELNRLFPGRVAPALAIPFGLFLDNVNRYAASSWQRLQQAYAAYRRGDIDDSALNAELESIRNAVAQVPLTDSLRQDLTTMMAQLFGATDDYGLFIRSDTNVEDLPGFTGAGLSKTVANVVGRDNQFKVIPEIWASVLAPRAVAWRSNLLKQPERVYPSVLLMKSVPSDKSGVLVTADLYTRRSGLTVSTAWGVGGAVEGEAVETLLLQDDGTEVLISEAKTPYRRALSQQGGIVWKAASDGPVLTAAEKQQLRALAREVRERRQPVMDADGKPLPWDIEFGFVQGELTLFQIRPLVERGQSRADRLLRELHGAERTLPAIVQLSAPPLVGNSRDANDENY